MFAEPQSPHLSEVGKDPHCTGLGGDGNEIGGSRKVVAWECWFPLPCKGAPGKDLPKNVAYHHPTLVKMMLFFSKVGILNYKLR